MHVFARHCPVVVPLLSLSLSLLMSSERWREPHEAIPRPVLPSVIPTRRELSSTVDIEETAMSASKSRSKAKAKRTKKNAIPDSGVELAFDVLSGDGSSNADSNEGGSDSGGGGSGSGDESSEYHDAQSSSNSENGQDSELDESSFVTGEITATSDNRRLDSLSMRESGEITSDRVVNLVAGISKPINRPVPRRQPSEHHDVPLLGEVCRFTFLLCWFLLLLINIPTQKNYLPIPIDSLKRRRSGDTIRVNSNFLRLVNLAYLCVKK